MPSDAKSKIPSSTQGKQPAGAKSYELPTFVSCELNEDEREQCKRSLVTVQSAFESVETLCSEGYKLSVSYDELSDCILVVLTATRRCRVNVGYALSARGAHLQGALTVLLYKHYEKLREDWHGSKPERKSQWG